MMLCWRKQKMIKSGYSMITLTWHGVFQDRFTKSNCLLVSVFIYISKYLNWFQSSSRLKPNFYTNLSNKLLPINIETFSCDITSEIHRICGLYYHVCGLFYWAFRRLLWVALLISQVLSKILKIEGKMQDIYICMISFFSFLWIL